MKDSLSSCPKLKIRKLKGLLRKGGVAHVVHLCPILQDDNPPSDPPPAVQQLIDSNIKLFQEPTFLPPAREFDHQIPLIPGVRPINIKPYRYSPT